MTDIEGNSYLYMMNAENSEKPVNTFRSNNQFTKDLNKNSPGMQVSGLLV